MTQQDSSNLSIIAIMVAVVSFAFSFLNHYASTLQPVVIDTVTFPPELQNVYYNNTIVIRNKTIDDVSVEIYIKSKVHIGKLAGFNTLYDEIHSMVMTKKYPEHKDLKLRIYGEMKNVLDSPNDISVYFHPSSKEQYDTYFHIKTSKGKDDE